MVAFDTNVIVRVLVGDDPKQTKRAERAFTEHANTDGIYVSILVLAEIAWVLSGSYQWDRALIHDRLSRLIRTRGVSVEDLAVVEWSLAAYRAGRSDLADYLIVAKARSVGAVLLTFDKRLAREPGVRAV